MRDAGGCLYLTNFGRSHFVEKVLWGGKKYKSQAKLLANYLKFCNFVLA